MIGRLTRHTGHLGAGHAAYTALSSGAGVVTSRVDQIRKILGGGWPIPEV